MKWISSRVSYEDQKDFFTMVISSKTDHWKMTVMLVWLLIWLTCGLVVFYFLFFTQELVGQKIYFYTFLAFWTYFLYKVSRVLIFIKVRAINIVDVIKIFHRRDKYRTFDNIFKINVR